MFKEISKELSPKHLRLKEIINYCRRNYNITHQQTYDFAVEGINICNEINLEIERHLLDIYKAFYLWLQGEISDAQIIVKKSAPILLHKKNIEYSLSIIITSLIEWAKGNVEIAFNIIHQAFDNLEGDEKSAVATNRLHWVLGVLYFDLGEIEKSYHHYNTCSNNLGNEVDLSLLSYTNIGLASVLVKKGLTKRAKSLFNETLISSRDHGIWMVEARTCHELGIIYLQEKAYKKATEFIKLSYDIRLENKAIPSLVSSMLTLAEIDIELKRYNQAVSTLNEALEVSKAKNLKHKESHIYRLLSDIHEKQNVFEAAFNMLKKHNRLEKELKNTTPDNKKNYLLLNYKAQKAEKESAYQKSINADLIQANQLIQQQKNRLSERNREKETLLKEIHHRVKNNLQIITSLLSLQSQNINNKEIKNLFANSQHRINSMALIHEMLYQTNNLAKINFRDYLSQLIKGLVSSFREDSNSIEIIDKIPVFFLNIDTAIPLGLLINEIVTNALKYAFNDQKKGILWLSIEKKDALNYLLKIGDNGPGIPDSIDIKNLNSLGLKLINRLSTQLKGSIQKDTDKKGTHYSILFQQVY